MASKSNSVDKTAQSTKTTVIDRKAVQQQGIQILDSVVHSADDKIIAGALGEVRNMLLNMGNANSVTVANLLKGVETVATMANKNQIEISRFGFAALEGARRDLRALADSGQLVIELADETVGKAMNMAERVAVDQARHQVQALEILSEAKTGDYADTLKSVSGMVMAFALLALVVVRGK